MKGTAILMGLLGFVVHNAFAVQILIGGGPCSSCDLTENEGGSYTVTINCSGGNDLCASIWISQARPYIEVYGCDCAIFKPTYELNDFEKASLYGIIPTSILDNPKGFLVYDAIGFTTYKEDIYFFDNFGTKATLTEIISSTSEYPIWKHDVNKIILRNARINKVSLSGFGVN